MADTYISENTTGLYAGTYSGVEDCRMREIAPTTNDDGSVLSIYKYQSGDHATTALSFSGLSNISATDTVSSATIGLYQTSADKTGHQIEFKRCLRNWVENQVTWNVYSTGNSWTSGGGQSDTNDRSSTSTGTFSPDTSNGWKTMSSAQLAADVEDFIDGTYSNYGHILEEIGVTNNYGWRYYDHSGGTDGQRPYLYVVHTAAGGGYNTTNNLLLLGCG